MNKNTSILQYSIALVKDQYKLLPKRNGHTALASLTFPSPALGLGIGSRNASNFPVCTYINWIHNHFQFSVHMQPPAPENHPSSSQHMQGHLDVKTPNSHEYPALQRSCSWTSTQDHFSMHLWILSQLLTITTQQNQINAGIIHSDKTSQ